MTQSIDALVERMYARGVAARAALRGCSADEISALESRFGVRLPGAYRRYLELMGHASGRLFTHDHLVATYADVMRENEQNERPPEEEDRPRVPLSPNGLIIAGRLGEQYLFIRCEGGSEAVVWYFSKGSNEAVKESHPSIAAWLECWCDEAAQAIASGYYERAGPAMPAVLASSRGASWAGLGLAAGLIAVMLGAIVAGYFTMPGHTPEADRLYGAGAASLARIGLGCAIASGIAWARGFRAIGRLLAIVVVIVAGGLLAAVIAGRSHDRPLAPLSDLERAPPSVEHVVGTDLPALEPIALGARGRSD